MVFAYNLLKQFYFKQFSLAKVCILNVKKFYFSLTVLIQTIQFSISVVFVYTLLNVKTVLF